MIQFLWVMFLFSFLKKITLEFDVQNSNNDKYKELIKIKKTNANGNLFIDLYVELKDYINYAKNFKFEQNPDYEYLESLLNKILVRKNLDIKKFLSVGLIINLEEKYLTL